MAVTAAEQPQPGTARAQRGFEVVRTSYALHMSWSPSHKVPDSIRAPSALEHRHPRLWAGIRISIGVWLLALTVVLYAYGVGGWWGALLVPAAALHFYFAYRLRHTTHG
jgi:hypothetical protein